MSEKEIVYTANISVGPKTYRYVLTPEQHKALIGRKIGEIIDGSIIGLDGYKFQITGGSDITGTPMVRYVDAQTTVYKVLHYGVGMRLKKIRYRKGKKRKIMAIKKRIEQGIVFKNKRKLTIEKIKRYARKRIRKGFRKKKRVHGNTISERIVQINMKAIEVGKKEIPHTPAPKESK